MTDIINENLFYEDVDRFCQKTGWLGKQHLVYWMTICQTVNKSGEKAIGVYPCSGADVLAFFLSTDAEVAYFIDTLSLDNAKQKAGGIYPEIKEIDYWVHKSTGGGLGGGFTWSSVLGATGGLEIPLRWELKAIGADNIEITEIKKNIHIIDFQWRYWGSRKSKSRKIYFFTNIDTRFPRQYPEMLKGLLKRGVDIYFEKAARDSYSQYNAPFDGGERWNEFTSFTSFNTGSIIISSRCPEQGITGFEKIKSDSMYLLQDTGSKFGVWTALLFRKI